MNKEFTVFCGPMFSSKTSKLLMLLDRYKYQNKKITLFKPKKDERYSTECVVTHSGLKYPAVIVENGKEIISFINDMFEFGVPDVVAVDELFMIEGIADVLIWLFTDLGINIVVSTLDLSSNLKPFHETQKVFSLATHIEKCSAVCAICGSDARYTHRFMRSEDEIVVGGSDLYEPRCYDHHPLLGNK